MLNPHHLIIFSISSKPSIFFLRHITSIGFFVPFSFIQFYHCLYIALRYPNIRADTFDTHNRFNICVYTWNNTYEMFSWDNTTMINNTCIILHFPSTHKPLNTSEYSDHGTVSLAGQPSSNFWCCLLCLVCLISAATSRLGPSPAMKLALSESLMIIGPTRKIAVW